MTDQIILRKLVNMFNGKVDKEVNEYRPMSTICNWFLRNAVL